MKDATARIPSNAKARHLLADALTALRLSLSWEMAWVLVKSAALSLLGLLLVWAGLHALPWPSVSTPWAWLDASLAVIGELGMILAVALLALPVLAVVIGLFLDEVAGRVERRLNPLAPPPHGAGLLEQLGAGLGLARAMLFWNLLAMPLYLLFPGLNVLIYLALNGSLIGREYFEMVALRRMGAAEMRRVRQTFKGQVFGAGALISALLLVPGVNLVVPFFGTAFMVCLAQRLAPASGQPGPHTSGLSDSADTDRRA